MAAQNVSKYFKFGYCKHRELCRRQHVNTLCENDECEISMCTFRHPKVCKYYRDYGYCKFDPCMFRHVDKEKDPEIEKLKQENESIKKQIANLETTINDFNTKILEKEDFIEKLVDVEKKLERVLKIEKDFCDKSSSMETLVRKIDALEDKLCEKDNMIKDLVEKVNKFSQNLKETNENIGNFNDLEEKRNRKDEKLLTCPNCSFQTNSKNGLKIHMKKKHV